MIHLPTFTKGTLVVACAALLGVCSARAATSYQDAVNAQLQLVGKSIQTASSAQLNTATWTVINSGSNWTNAGYYLHDVLALRTDKNSIAAGLISSGLTSGTFSTLIPSNPSLSGSIAGLATSGTDLSSTALANVAEAVIEKAPLSVRKYSALSVGNSVSLNLTGGAVELARTTFATKVATGLVSSGVDVIGNFIAGVSNNSSDWIVFSKVIINTSALSNATPEILASEISQDSSRVALSGSLAAMTATGASSKEKGLIAEGIIRAIGSANTASIINTILSIDRGVSGKEVTLANLSTFSAAVAAAVTRGNLSAEEIAATMRIASQTIANGIYASAVGKPLGPLTELQKAQITAAAVKVLPNLNDHLNNPVNAYLVGVLNTTGTLADPYGFAVKVAKGATNAGNAGQVANAIANYLVASSSLSSGTTFPLQYLQLSGSLFKAFSTNSSYTTEISRRIAQLIPPNSPAENQAARVNYAAQLTALFPNSAKSIAMGVSLTDTQYADDVASAVISVNTTTKNKAAEIAGALANSVSAQYACEIAASVGGLIESKVLKLSQSSAIASAIANGGAIRNSPSDLGVVSAQLIEKLMANYVSGATDPLVIQNNSDIVNAVAAVAHSVASVSYKYNLVKTSTNPDLYTGGANLVAGASAQAAIINLMGPNDGPARDTVLLAIAKAVTSVTPDVGDNFIASAVNSVRLDPTSKNYNTDINITTQETPVTNY